MTEENIKEQIEKQPAKGSGDVEGRLEKQVAEALKEMLEGRVARAENHAAYMRNWLAILTATITAAFLIFSVLGYRSFSELETFKKQMQQNADAVATKKQEVEAEVQKAEQELTALRTHQQGLEQDLSTLEARFANVREKSGLARSTPMILKTPNIAIGWMTLEGRNFGKTHGQLYAYVQEGTSISAPIRIEQSSIQGWTETSLSVSLSQTDIAALSKVRSDLKPHLLGGVSPGVGVPNLTFPPQPSETPFLCFQVVTADAKASEWSSPISWP